MKICLCIIYNHNYEKNIRKIECLYAERFDTIYHLMPFYSNECGGEKKKSNSEKVISIYESSHNFEGYVAQGIKRFYSDIFDYYIFVADDLILNPSITQDNIIDILKCNENTAYIKQLDFLTKKKKLRYIPFTEYFYFNKKIYHWSNAPEDLNDHGWYIKETENCLTDSRFFKITQFITEKTEAVQKCITKGIPVNEIQESGTDYPRFLSFSDFFVVPKRFIKQFSRLCGAYAASNLHAEVAVPTALFYSCDHIMTEKEIEWFGAQKHKMNEDIIDGITLEKSFEEKQLFVHPVKLSLCNIE